MMKQEIMLLLPKSLNTASACIPRSGLASRFLQRAATMALSRQGVDYRSIAIFTTTHPRTVLRWSFRIKEGRGLSDAKRCGRPRFFSEGTRLKVIAAYCQSTPPLPGVNRWSLRDAQSHFKENQEVLGQCISHSTIQRILRSHALRPHLHKYFLQITDPDFFPKMEHIIECYSNSLPNLYCFDECTGIQALKRQTPALPPEAGRPVLEDFDYYRNGTTDLFAFLNPATGQVYGQCADNHNRHTLSQIFTDHVRMHPDDSVIHYIMDNFSSHYHDDFCRTVAELSGVEYSPLKTGPQRRQWLQSDHKRIMVHFIPFHASWLNMVEIWFGILKAKCLKYEHFFSVAHLRESIMHFIATWNEFYAHPFQWSYTGNGLHGKAVQRFSRLLSIETEQMDAKFLMKQLQLMTNISQHYLDYVSPTDWQQFQKLAAEKKEYITRIIDTDTKPRRQKKARKAYLDFEEVVMNRYPVLNIAA